MPTRMATGMSRRLRRKNDANVYHATVRVDVRRGTHTAPSTSITVAEAAEVWIKRVEADARERATIRQYRQHVDGHIVPRLGRTKLAHLSPKAVERFRDDLLSKLSRPMARKVLGSFKSLLRVSKHAHVADDTKISRNKRAERKLEAGRDIPTPAEIKRLIAAAKPGRQRALLLVAATCGLRASELRGLRWHDVDLKGSRLRVSQRAIAMAQSARRNQRPGGARFRWHPRRCRSCARGGSRVPRPRRTLCSRHAAEKLRITGASGVASVGSCAAPRLSIKRACRSTGHMRCAISSRRGASTASPRGANFRRRKCKCCSGIRRS